MQDEVKFIFKTLIKVPVIIMVCYAVFNVFAFSLCYFKMLGISYVVMQTAIENNYVPSIEGEVLTKYMDNTLKTDILEHPKWICDTKGVEVDKVAEDNANNVRVQYGQAITVVVKAHYKFIWPLQPIEQTSGNKAVMGMKGNASEVGSNLSADQLQTLREEKYEKNPDNNIVISYTVPGLKYYPDLG